MHGRRFFRLDSEGTPVQETDKDRWWSWMTNTEDDRDIGNDLVGSVRIWTMFLGMDSSGEDPPLVWETRIEGGAQDGTTRKYATAELAAAGHQELVKAIQAAERQQRSNGQWGHN